MKTPVVAEIPSKRIRALRQESRAKRARQAAGGAYRRRTASDDVRPRTAFTRWVGR